MEKATSDGLWILPVIRDIEGGGYVGCLPTTTRGNKFFADRMYVHKLTASAICGTLLKKPVTYKHIYPLISLSKGVSSPRPGNERGRFLLCEARPHTAPPEPHARFLCEARSYTAPPEPEPRTRLRRRLSFHPRWV